MSHPARPRHHHTGARLLVAASVLGAFALTGCAQSTRTSAFTGTADARTTITIKNFKFTPAKLTVSPGARVTVVNKDSTTHTVTADDKKDFDTHDIAAGKSKTFKAPSKQGAHAYHCTIHPFMKGSLTVS